MIKRSGHTADDETKLNDIVKNPNERVAMLKPRRHASFSVTSQESHLRSKHLELGSLVSISLSWLLSGSSGRGSAAAWRYLVQNKIRFARKRLVNIGEYAVILACGWTIL